MKNIQIKIDDLKDGKVMQLLQEHHREMHLYSPSESIHALDENKMLEPTVSFWSAWDGDILAACGALKHLSNEHGEIKAMRTSPAYLRQGIAEKILICLLEEAKKRGYKNVSLETGSHQAFIPAVNLYKKFGFEQCGPFGSYRLDPHSIFLKKKIGYSN